VILYGESNANFEHSWLVYWAGDGAAFRSYSFEEINLRFPVVLSRG